MFTEGNNIPSQIKRRLAHAQSSLTLWNARQSVGTGENFKVFLFSSINMGDSRIPIQKI